MHSIPPASFSNGSYPVEAANDNALGELAAGGLFDALAPTSRADVAPPVSSIFVISPPCCPVGKDDSDIYRREGFVPFL